MQPKKRALGRGLEALLPQKPTKAVVNGVKDAPVNSSPTVPPTVLSITAIRRNEAQPRQYFDEEAILGLSESIKLRGLIQPIAVMPRKNDYVIVAGERRWRAAQLAGLREVPVIILDALSDQDLLEYALVENLQREDLNPLEEARAYQSLQRAFSLTAEDIAERVGKSRPAVANALRLLTLSAHMQEDIEAERITAGHARAILSLENNRDQVILRDLIVTDYLSVRQAELKAKEMIDAGASRKGKSKQRTPPKVESEFVQRLREQLVDSLACRVSISTTGEDQGKIEIHYQSLDELQGVLERLGIQS